ncbi:rubrerythrin family protein [Halovenus sp. WSH3]|uniref:Rubrerythrin family protein n=1 Tax=Halovenus carboxidivorans TaxID=2692199 RepID=A0A6B0T1I1_9EURY|nr:rubrerythrin family protein [Halovenus carboxidivorans]MXR50086.1 rubrerythrin family protein [Halovenus carboxidivorans]
MDSAELLDTLEQELQTELSRLGSSKSLYADTEGEMDADPILRAAADSAATAIETFEGWEGEVFADAAEYLREQYADLVDELGEHEAGDPPAVVEALGDAEGEIERLGATVGWSLVVERKSTQSSGYFTGQAQPGTASTFRSFGDDYEAIREAALDAIDDACDSDEEYEQAEDGATAVIEAAYDEYFETLESLGMNPKPVC